MGLDYTSNLSNEAGTFKPFESFWDRWFASKGSSKGIGAEQEMIFPDDSKHPLNHLNVPPLHRNTPSPFSRQTSRTTLGSPKLTKFGSGGFSATTIVEDPDYDLKVKESDLANDGLYHDLPPTNQGLLKKHRSTQNKAKRFNAKSSKDAHGFVKKKRDPVKFMPSGGFQSDSSDDDDDEEIVKGKAQRPWLKQSPSMTSTATAVSVSSPTSGKAKNQHAKDDGVDLDYEKEMERIKEYRAKQGDVPEYSDYESDLGSPVKEKGNGEAWTPGFIRRASQRSGSGSGSQGASVKAGSNASTSTLVPPSPTTTSASGPPALGQPTPTSPSAGPPAFLSGLGAVPATPSLIKALDRVALAQKDAYSGSAGTGLPRVEEEAQDKEDTKGTPANAQPDGKRWESFWKEVGDKAAS
ncbi:hypothetical protein VKT23_006369 [Stygiomarasmius scandens]|uniref:Uncharacterized protein n=1 Tax=Marasmiellus scandens TaxID=2682957 RepID=A0ABR1JT93_9AGAR